jgi:hypothetical protein
VLLRTTGGPLNTCKVGVDGYSALLSDLHGPHRPSPRTLMGYMDPKLRTYVLEPDSLCDYYYYKNELLYLYKLEEVIKRVIVVEAKRLTCSAHVSQVRDLC